MRTIWEKRALGREKSDAKAPGQQDEATEDREGSAASTRLLLEDIPVGWYRFVEKLACSQLYMKLKRSHQRPLVSVTRETEPDTWWHVQTINAPGTQEGEVNRARVNEAGTSCWFSFPNFYLFDLKIPSDFSVCHFNKH